MDPPKASLIVLKRSCRATAKVQFQGMSASINSDMRDKHPSSVVLPPVAPTSGEVGRPMRRAAIMPVAAPMPAIGLDGFVTRLVAMMPAGLRAPAIRAQAVLRAPAIGLNVCSVTGNINYDLSGASARSTGV